MKIRFIAILLLLFALVVALAGGFTLLWRFFMFLAVLLVLDYLWIWIGACGIEYKTKETVDHCQFGDYINEDFTISHRGILPTSLMEISEDTDLPGYSNTATVALARKDSYRWDIRTRCLQRGRYRLGTLDVKFTDPLGFLSLSRRLGNNREITVYPAVLNLPLFDVVPRIEPGLGPQRRLVSEVGPGASRVREYTSGDSLRHIHWRSTARTGKLMVKEFDPDPSNYAFQDVWLVLDMNRDIQTGEGIETTEEYMITVAASLAKKYIKGGKRVGLIASGERPCLHLPEAGDQHLQGIMRSLAVVKAGGEVTLDTLLTSESGLFDANSALITIAPSGSRGIAVPLRRIMNRGSFVISVLLDSFSFGGGADDGEAYRTLNSSGVSVYVIRKGMDIARALDSRTAASRPYHGGDRIQKWIAVT